MENWFKYFVVLLVVSSAITQVLLVWVLAIVWDGAYNGKTVVLDAVSLQISILEVMLALGGIVLAMGGFWGYQKIKEFVSNEIRKFTDRALLSMVNTTLDERGYPARSRQQGRPADARGAKRRGKGGSGGA